jgi:anionic cell wall polymer biosynthesis LytR-Cps2A-Psr (LCP) family protein
MKKLKCLLLVILFLVSVHSSFALPLVMKKSVKTTSDMIKGSASGGRSFSYELLTFDSTKYKQVRVAVYGYSSGRDNNIYLEAVEGSDSFSLGSFRISGGVDASHSGSMLIDGAPSKIRIASYEQGSFIICIWAQ